MAKNKKKNNEIIKEEYNNMFSVKSTILTILIVGIIFVLFYLLSGFITGRSYKYNRNKVDASISYEEIMAGSTFNMNKDSYVVVFYYREDDSELTNQISIYGSREGNSIYYVDLKNGINKYILDDNSNRNATNASELRVTNPTLIKIEDGFITEFIEGKDNIINYLK